MLASAPQVGLIGVQPVQPAALVRPGQVSGRSVGVVDGEAPLVRVDALVRP